MTTKYNESNADCYLDGNQDIYFWLLPNGLVMMKDDDNVSILTKQEAGKEFREYVDDGWTISDINASFKAMLAEVGVSSRSVEYEVPKSNVPTIIVRLSGEDVESIHADCDINVVILNWSDSKIETRTEKKEDHRKLQSAVDDFIDESDEEGYELSVN